MCQNKTNDSAGGILLKIQANVVRLLQYEVMLIFFNIKKIMNRTIIAYASININRKNGTIRRRN